ncbi:MAG: hypothetical protein WBP49_13385 [Acidimicrobiia bacterium]
MSDHDLDLITELINGHLSPDERRAALARVAADPELQSEYESQLAVSSLLSDAPSPTMTAAERSELRTALRQQLNLDSAPAAAVIAPSRWQRWWAPATGLAAAAAVIIGVVIILPDSGSDDSLQFAAAQVETTVQASRNGGADTGGSAGSADTADEEPTTTTAAASGELASPATAEDTIDDSVGAASESSPEALPHIPEVDLDQLGLAYAEGPSEFEDELNKSARGVEPVETSEVWSCLLAETGDPAGEPSLEIVASGAIDGVDVVVVSVTPPSGDAYLIAVDADTCEELASTRP